MSVTGCSQSQATAQGADAATRHKSPVRARGRVRVAIRPLWLGELDRSAGQEHLRGLPWVLSWTGALY